MHKSLIALLLVLFILPSAAFADDGVYPFIVIRGQNATQGDLIGAWGQGQWLSPESAIPYIKAGKVYTTYGMDGYSQEVIGIESECPGGYENYGEIMPYCQAGVFIKKFGVHTYIPFSTKFNGTATSAAVSGEWDAMPRTVTRQDAQHDEYISYMRKILEQEGLVDPCLTIGEKLHIDIDGDGYTDSIIAASGEGRRRHCLIYYMIDGNKEKCSDAATKIFSYVLTEITIYNFVFSKVVGILDLNNDNVMEVVFQHTCYEYLWYSIYQFQNGAFKEVKLQ